MYTVKINEFQGPFDLLLQMIEEQRLDITKVSLADITEDYIRIIQDNADKIKPDELADFLVIAAKLLVIKSKALMPYLIWNEEEEEIDLEKQLRMYKEYFEASKTIQKMLAKNNFGFSREKFLVVGEVGFHPPEGVNAGKLGIIFNEILKGLAPILNLPKSVVRRTINIQEKINRIRNIIIEKASTVNFTHILREAKDKTEVIVSFLAVLELIKQKDILVRQENIFEEIIIEKITQASS